MFSQVQNFRVVKTSSHIVLYPILMCCMQILSICKSLKLGPSFLPLALLPLAFLLFHFWPFYLWLFYLDSLKAVLNTIQSINQSSPNNKDYDLSKLKAFADDNLIASYWIYLRENRNHSGKRRNLLITSNFPFPMMFSKGCIFW